MDLNETQLWYVRAAIRRGIAAVDDSIKEAEQMLENLPEDSPMYGTVEQMTTNMISYNKQLLREMTQYIPEELQE